jgi:DNA-binding beta-propeller fold protein YncE
MNRSSQNACIAALTAVFLMGGSVIVSQESSPLELKQSVTLPGYSGDFDHFAVDSARGRILLAAEDHATLEVFDLKTGKHLRTVSGFGAPHSILVRPNSPTILVTDSDKMTHILDADTYSEKASVKLTPGADSAAYDATANVYYVVTGGKDVDMKSAYLEAINPDSGEELGKIEFADNHVEALALEGNGRRAFINLTQTNKIAVVDRKSMTVVATWAVTPARQNAMVAFDEPNHRLYVVCRDPGMLVVMNSDTGEVTNTLPAPLRVDDLLFDRSHHRLYVPGGEGFLGIYDTSDPDHLKQIARVKTAPGAKTGLLLPDSGKLILAASPGDTKNVAAVMTFAIH